MDENVLKVFKCIWWEKVMAIWYILLAITRTKYLTENVLHVLETKTGFSLFVKKKYKNVSNREEIWEEKKLNRIWWNLRNVGYFHNMTDPD